MPQFILTINLGNDAMQTDEDIADALQSVASEMIIEGPMYVSEKRHIADRNGNTVGSYQVVP